MQGWATCRAVARLFVLDVFEGMRRVSHNALAMLGLAAVAIAVFVAGRADVRAHLEERALGWLMERATSRAAAQAALTEEDDNAELLAMAEPEAIQRATATNPSELNRQQAAVAYWLSRRYNVAPEPVSRLVQEAWEAGHRAGLEPTLVLAVMAIESGFNPFAQSHVGAQGLMQVMTRVHHDKYEIFGGLNAAFDPVTNVRVGVQVLKDCIHRAGSLQLGLKYYVGAANLIDDGGYAGKVLAEQAYLRKVATGIQVPVTATLPQTVLQAQATPALTATPAAPHAGPGTTITPTSVPAALPSAAPAVVPAALPAASDSAPAQPQPAARRTEQVAMLGAGAVVAKVD